MTEEVLPDLYKIEVPLPRNPLKALNSYVIKSQKRNMIVDTGMNREECMTAMNFALKELDVDLDKTDFFITHMHADHLGLVSALATDTSTIFLNQQDADIVMLARNPEYWYAGLRFASLNGFPEKELKEALEKHPGYRYSAKGNVKFTIPTEGTVIDVGDYRFKYVETPGHTEGHTCLYEPDRKILVAGDHILLDITPNISLWNYEHNLLEQYMTSLDKVYRLDVRLVLPGHRRIFRDSRKRIRELKEHHQTRIEEILSILDKGAKTAYQIASQMSWDLDCGSWDLFPVSQKWFATGEAIAHLKYLDEKGTIKRETSGDRIKFLLK
jgi:glyoxylase-like metal-dependent hydrolase (beta-lactamase superfamily II)